MATENQLVVRSFKRERAVPGAHYTEMPLATVIEGRFAGIHQFLHDLNRLFVPFLLFSILFLPIIGRIII